MQTGPFFLSTSAALLLGLIPLVVAHGHDVSPAMEMGGAHSGQIRADGSSIMTPEHLLPPSYFRHVEYTGWMYAHIALMIWSWVLVLPLATFLSVARSRFNLPAQMLFHIVNGVGMFTGFVYNHGTPDLYENNAHHKIGWIMTSFAALWTLSGLVNLYTDRKTPSHLPSNAHHSMMTRAAMAHHQQNQQYQEQQYQNQQYQNQQYQDQQYQDQQYQDQQYQDRFSQDSGQGTERNSASLDASRPRSHSSDSIFQKPEEAQEAQDEHLGDEDDRNVEHGGFLRNTRVDHFLSRNVPRLAMRRSLTAIKAMYTLFEKTLLLCGFLALTSGFVTYGGIFRDRNIFSGLAHFTKGAIFFWYGLLTLGRWMGAFSNFGWAWNVRPRHTLASRFASRMPSAEFVESFVIWLYGASNVFLEHLNAWGQPWSAQDFEHVSITLLFFGGGLLGMLVESGGVRDLLNTTVLVAQHTEAEQSAPSRFAQQPAAWKQPESYTTSLNPMPGLVIMLLGITMSAHHQHSAVSTAMHAQWGTLFVGFAVARAATYTMLYLKPPTTHYPSRPPSELVAAFCLSAGGLLFMGSSSDTVAALQHNGLNAMLVLTLTLGLTALVMAWEITLFALKGWSLRYERAAAGLPLPS